MKRTNRFSVSFKNFGVLCMIFTIGIIVLSLFSCGPSIILIFYTNGEGIVVDKMNRSGPGSGLFVRVKGGEEFRVLPDILWHKIEVGDFLIKEKYSFTYMINNTEYNALIYLMKSFSMVLSIIILLVVFDQLYKHSTWYRRR